VSDIPTCREVLTFLGDYHAGDLDPMRTAAFERHLALCESCCNYLDSYRRTIVLEREAFDDPALQDPPQELIEAILAIRRPG
jgi:anti-sigma factor RsiW